MSKYLKSYIPYSEIDSTMESNSRSGDKDIFPRSVRGNDIVLVEYDEANRSTYDDYSALSQEVSALTDKINFNNESLLPINRLALDSPHLEIKYGANTVGAEIVDVKIVSGGTGYSEGTLTSSGGGGSNFNATYTVDGNGAIDGVKIINHGNGFVSPASIVISDSGNGDANLTAVMGVYNGFGDSNESNYGLLGLKVSNDVLSNIHINSSAGIDATKLGNGDVTNTELSYINSTTSNVQTQLDAKLPLSGGTMTGQVDFNNQRAIGFQRVQMESGGWFNNFIDDDDMSGASNTTVSSSESIKAYVDTTVRDIRSSGFNYGYTGGTKVYIPLGVSTSESTTVVGRNEFANFVVPYDGYLDQVIVRSEEACGSTIVGFHKSSTGVEVPNSTATGTKTVDMAVDDTAYKFDFTRDNTFSAGDIIAISFDPTNDANDTNATVVLVYDVTQGV